jgi:hypothetical protein
VSWHGGDADCPHLAVIYPLEQDCDECGASFRLPPKRIEQLPGQLAFDDCGSPDPGVPLPRTAARSARSR